MSYLHWKDFVDPDLLALIRQTSIDQHDRFTETTVTTGEPGYRKSKVLWHHNFQDLYDRFSNRLKHYLPDIKQVFPQLDNPSIELQMTAHNDGEYFKRHTDNGCEQTRSRVMTYVYYYTLTDESHFTGGELILETDQGAYTISPTHNSIIMFPAGWYHEVLPVRVPSKRWEDARYTINGWLRI